MQRHDRLTAEGFLFTDQYQLTMAQLYYRMGLHEKTVQFDHFFRSYPDYGSHAAGYCINAGLAWLLDWMQEAQIRDSDIDYMRAMRTADDRQLFDDDFLAWLRANGTFDGLTLRAIPEGRVVHANVPLTMVEGPLALAQILETSLLNHLNYQTLIATKAARIKAAGRGKLMLEFGMRRGHERGVNAGTRAALIGGADFSSNAGISHVLGYPPRGTHAHSMVQLFVALGGDEYEAFKAYGDLYPDDCLLLVDTVNTLESGVPNAIRVFEELRSKGHQPVGVRLDSGDLAYLAVQTAGQLNAAGFSDTAIILSDSLDEMAITQILQQIEEEAPQYGLTAESVIGRLVYGVGTRLITSQGSAALGGVYKLVAVQHAGDWLPAIKISDNAVKTPNPGNKRAWRVYDARGMATADLLTLDDEQPSADAALHLRHPIQAEMRRTLLPDQITAIEPLHVDVLDRGRRVYDPPPVEALRAARDADLERLDPGVRRILRPHIYHVSLSEQLWSLKQQLIRSLR